MKTIIRASLSLLVASTLCAGAQANEIIVTPADLGTPGAINKWYLDNYRGVGVGSYTSVTSAAITGTQPRNGNGSVEMSLTDGSGKADYVYTWGYMQDRTLGSLNSLSYDWYRAGGSAPANLQPALRLLYDADGNAATTSDLGYLVFEQVYNAPSFNNPVPVNQWVNSNLIGANFWMRQFTPGNTVESYNNTLADWMGGAHPTSVADLLSANTAILGVEFGIGSGWKGSFSGFVDNVSVGFGRDSTTFNFETTRTDVPEPASLALVGLGLLGVAVQRRRKGTKA